MANYTYKVVGFGGHAKASRVGDISGQLEAAINAEATDGWEFYQLQAVNVQVAPGCLSSLFGAEASYIQVDQLIFRRPAD